MFIQPFTYSQLFIECLLQFGELQRQKHKLGLVFRSILSGTSYYLRLLTALAPAAAAARPAHTHTPRSTSHRRLGPRRGNQGEDGRGSMLSLRAHCVCPPVPDTELLTLPKRPPHPTQHLPPASPGLEPSLRNHPAGTTAQGKRMASF